MFAWDNEDVQQCNAGVVRGLARSGQTETLGSLGNTESRNHRIAAEQRILQTRRVARRVRAIQRDSTNPDRA